MSNIFTKKRIVKAVKNPHKIPVWVYKKLFPFDSIDNVTKENGYITFEEGGFVASPSNRAEFSAKIYYEVSGLRDHLVQLPREHFSRSLEIGCGYGRLTPWIAEFSQDHFAIEPNKEALIEAEKSYPHVKFKSCGIENAPFNGECFDLVVSWTVLQHIPDKEIKHACQKIYNITNKNGIVVLAENTESGNSISVWDRSVEEYSDMLNMKVLSYDKKPVEKTYDGSGGGHKKDRIIILNKK